MCALSSSLHMQADRRCTATAKTQCINQRLEIGRTMGGAVMGVLPAANHPKLSLPKSCSFSFVIPCQPISQLLVGCSGELCSFLRCQRLYGEQLEKRQLLPMRPACRAIPVLIKYAVQWCFVAAHATNARAVRGRPHIARVRT